MKMTRSLLLLMVPLLFFGTRASAQDSGSPTTLSGQPQVAQPREGGVNWKGVGIAAGTVLSNVVYVPLKLVYGILGGIGGGAGYALTGGNKQVADTIWQNSLGGDYVLTPKKLTGEEPIYFSGPNEAGALQNPIVAESQSPANMPNPHAASFPTPGATGNASPATRPIDNGGGPVGASATSQPSPYAAANDSGATYSGSRSYSHPSKRSQLTDTSIE